MESIVVVHGGLVLRLGKGPDGGLRALDCQVGGCVCVKGGGAQAGGMEKGTCWVGGSHVPVCWQGHGVVDRGAGMAPWGQAAARRWACVCVVGCIIWCTGKQCTVPGLAGSAMWAAVRCAGAPSGREQCVHCGTMPGRGPGHERA